MRDECAPVGLFMRSAHKQSNADRQPSRRIGCLRKGRNHPLVHLKAELARDFLKYLLRRGPLVVVDRATGHLRALRQVLYVDPIHAFFYEQPQGRLLNALLHRSERFTRLILAVHEIIILNTSVQSDVNVALRITLLYWLDLVAE